MEVVHERCAGLDVHKETVVGCVRVSERGEVRHEVQRFPTWRLWCDNLAMQQLRAPGAWSPAAHTKRMRANTLKLSWPFFSRASRADKSETVLTATLTATWEETSERCGREWNETFENW